MALFLHKKVNTMQIEDILKWIFGKALGAGSQVVTLPMPYIKLVING